MKFSHLFLLISSNFCIVAIVFKELSFESAHVMVSVSLIFALLSAMSYALEQV